MMFLEPFRASHAWLKTSSRLIMAEAHHRFRQLQWDIFRTCGDNFLQHELRLFEIDILNIGAYIFAMDLIFLHGCVLAFKVQG